MESSVLRKSLNGYDLLVVNIFEWRRTRANRHVVDQDGARAAEAFATTEFRSCQSKIGAQHPEQHPIRVNGQLHGFAIEFELDFFCHTELLVLNHKGKKTAQMYYFLLKPQEVL
jgi:hypothetical protein